jgi:hypothetical protein
MSELMTALSERSERGETSTASDGNAVLSRRAVLRFCARCTISIARLTGESL